MNLWYSRWVGGGLLAGAMLMLPACESTQPVSADRSSDSGIEGVEALTGRVDDGGPVMSERAADSPRPGRPGFAIGANRLRPESRR